MTIEAAAFREVLGSFATGVTVVTLPSDPPHGLTANAFSSVSLDPPLVLVCVDHETRTFELLTEGGIDSFCVNILAADQQHLGEYFANMTELDEDPFRAEPTTVAETNAPIFEQCIGYLDCSIWQSYDGGDHTIYVGEVIAAEILDESASALTFFRGNWGQLAAE